MSQIRALADGANKLQNGTYRNIITSNAQEKEIDRLINEEEVNKQAARIAKSREENKTGTLEEFGGGNGREY